MLYKYETDKTYCILDQKHVFLDPIPTKLNKFDTKLTNYRHISKNSRKKLYKKKQTDLGPLNCNHYDQNS